MNGLLPHRRFFSSLLLVALSNGLLALQWLSAPAEPPPMADAPMPWLLPAQPQQDTLLAAYGLLDHRSRWKNSAAPGTPEAAAQAALATSTEQAMAGAALTPTPWRLMGVAREGNQKYALLADGGNIVKRYATGSQLPDDSRVQAIYETSIELEHSAQRHSLYLYRPLPKK